MKNLSLVTVFSLSLIFLSGCSHFGGGKKGDGVEGSMTEGGVETSGFEDEESFSEYGVNAANKLKAPYNQTYYFDLDSFLVDQSDVHSIKTQANYLDGHPKAKIRLEGHTDERGSREYNVALGWKRAKAVASILEQYGVGESQIAIVSYGKEKPVAFGQNEYSYSKNRRVNLVYEAK